jgi:isopenicillin N synthase-like dioxygenase
VQVRDRSEQWHDVEYMPDAFVVNIGDLMQRWTNDQWVGKIYALSMSLP